MIRNKNIINAGWIIGCKIVQAVLGVVISMLTARYLGPSNFGVINYAAAIIAFVSPIAKLGLSHVVVQEVVCSPDDEGKIVGTSLTMSLISSAFCILGVVSFSLITSSSDMETVIVCALYSILLISHALEIVQYWFQAKLISKYVSVVSVIAYIVISLYKVILLVSNRNVYWFAVSNAIDHLMIGIALLFIYKKKSNQKLEVSLQWARKLFSKSKFFIIAGMMVTVFAQTDKIMLKFMIDDVATGIYSAASAGAGITSFIFAAIIDSARPTIVENKKKTLLAYETSICNLYSIIIYMAAIQSIMMTVLAKPIIYILYGSEYFDSISALRIIVWYTTFSYIGSVRNVWMLTEDKQRYLWIINLSGAIINVGLNLLFIPLWGIEGAAFASVITQVFTNFILTFILKPIRYNNTLIFRSLHPRFLVSMVKSVLKRKL